MFVVNSKATMSIKFFESEKVIFFFRQEPGPTSIPAQVKRNFRLTGSKYCLAHHHDRNPEGRFPSARSMNENRLTIVPFQTDYLSCIFFLLLQAKDRSIRKRDWLHH